MMFKLILALLIVLAIAFFSTSLGNEAVASPYGAGKYSANVPYGGQTQLTLSTSGNIVLSVVPSDSGALATASGTVTVISTDVVGYKLYVRSLTSTNMVNGAVIIPTSANGSPASLAVNTWGYSLSGGGTFTGMSLSDTLIRSATQPYTGGDVTTVTYGVNVNNTKKAGNYSNSVVYTAVPQTN